MPENALSKPRHAACQVVKQSKLLVMMQDLNRSSTFYIMRPWQPCAGRSSVGREAIVVILAVAKKCCSSRENTGLMVQCDKRCKQKHTHTPYTASLWFTLKLYFLHLPSKQKSYIQTLKPHEAILLQYRLRRWSRWWVVATAFDRAGCSNTSPRQTAFAG